MANPILQSRAKWSRLASIWRSASLEDQFRIPCNDYPTAKRLRWELYATIRRARKPRSFDQELLNIAEESAVTMEGNDIIIYKRKYSPITEKCLEAVEKAEVDCSFERLQQAIGSPVDSCPCPTPFAGELDENGDLNPYYKKGE